MPAFRKAEKNRCPRLRIGALARILWAALLLAPADASALAVAGGRGGSDTDLNIGEASILAYFPDFAYYRNLGYATRASGSPAGGSAVYLGYGGWVMTASHVTTAAGAHIDGVTYPMRPGTRLDFPLGPDILLFQLDDSADPLPDLPDVPVSHKLLEAGETVILSGGGRHRTGLAAQDPFVPDTDASNCSEGGYLVTAYTDWQTRWGTSEARASDPTFLTFTSAFEPPAPGEWLDTNRAALTHGDSGGGAFAYDPDLGSWALVGINRSGGDQGGSRCFGGDSIMTRLGSLAEDLEPLGIWPANPHAVAGDDQTHYDQDGDGLVTVTLDGSGSYDNDGSVVDWDWSVGGQSIASGEVANVELGIGTYEIVLTATDDDDLISTASLVVEVGPDVPPVADAGPDQYVPTEGEVTTITLDGTGSFEPGGTIVAWEWSYYGIPFSNDPVFTSSLFPLGSYEFTLTVTDDDGETASDTVLIEVVENMPPTAVAQDVLVGDNDDDGTEDVVFDGSGSYDPDGTIVSWEWWIRLGGQSFYQFSGETHTLEGVPAGFDFEYVLFVTDDLGRRSVGKVIRVQVVSNQPPQAVAAPSAPIVDTDGDGFADVTFDGSQSFDTDGQVVEWEWWIVLGGQAFYQFSGETFTLEGTPVGFDYEYQLFVVDDLGRRSQADTIRVQVVSRPVADAGPDILLVDQDGNGVEDVTFDGSGSSSPNGDIVAWEWWVLLGGQAFYQFSGETYTLQGVPVGFDLEYVLIVEDELGVRSAQDKVRVQVTSP
jgi:hypothetical protein